MLQPYLQVFCSLHSWLYPTLWRNVCGPLHLAAAQKDTHKIASPARDSIIGLIRITMPRSAISTRMQAMLPNAAVNVCFCLPEMPSSIRLCHSSRCLSGQGSHISRIVLEQDRYSQLWLSSVHVSALGSLFFHQCNKEDSQRASLLLTKHLPWLHCSSGCWSRFLGLLKWTIVSSAMTRLFTRRTIVQAWRDSRRHCLVLQTILLVVLSKNVTDSMLGHKDN